MGADEHEQLVFANDPRTGLRAIIAIHSTALGPAIGGTRFFDYPSEDEALADALRLSHSMTYKSAISGLELGGGKAVIIGDPTKVKTEPLIRAFAAVVEGMGGTYITGQDIGTSAADVALIATETRWVLGLPESQQGSGDASQATVRGLIAAMRATAAHVWGDGGLAGKVVAVQGVGKVGSGLVRRLLGEGAEVVVADVDDEVLARVQRELGCEAVGAEAVFDVECDIFAPCALGGALNRETIPRLRCAAVVGSANNALATDDDALRLAERNIVFSPDFVVNAGALLNVAEELGGFDPARAAAVIDGIFDTLTAVLERAAQNGTTPYAAAIEMAEERLSAATERPGAKPMSR